MGAHFNTTGIWQSGKAPLIKESLIALFLNFQLMVDYILGTHHVLQNVFLNQKGRLIRRRVIMRLAMISHAQLVPHAKQYLVD